MIKRRIVNQTKFSSTYIGKLNITGLKKIDLAYKIIDHYAVNPSVAKDEKKLETNISMKDSYIVQTHLQDPLGM